MNTRVEVIGLTGMPKAAVGHVGPTRQQGFSRTQSRSDRGCRDPSEAAQVFSRPCATPSAKVRQSTVRRVTGSRYSSRALEPAYHGRIHHLVLIAHTFHARGRASLCSATNRERWGKKLRRASADSAPSRESPPPNTTPSPPPMPIHLKTPRRGSRTSTRDVLPERIQ